MPAISGGGAVPAASYTPNIMLDVPAGVLISNAPVAPGVEVYAANVGTRFVVDWATMPVPVSFTRLQVVAKSSATTPPVQIKIRDVTNNVDLDVVDVSTLGAALTASAWRVFNQPTGPVTYAVFVQGNGAVDPTVYSVLWE